MSTKTKRHIQFAVSLIVQLAFQMIRIELNDLTGHSQSIPNCKHTSLAIFNLTKKP